MTKVMIVFRNFANAPKKVLKINTRCIKLIIQGVSRLVYITAGGGDFLGFVIKKVHINMCPILDGYGVMGIF